MSEWPSPQQFGPPEPAPVLNAPPIVVQVILTLVVCHLLKSIFMLGIDIVGIDRISPLLFAILEQFILYPQRAFDFTLSYGPGILIAPWGHGLLHGNIFHLVVNCGFLLAFGSPLARCLGKLPFLSLLFLGVIAGGYGFCILHQHEDVALIGISGGVSALLGALLRPKILPFAKAPFLAGPLQTRRSALMLLFVFGGTNLLLALVPVGQAGLIAWEAHLVGFLAGFLLFPALYRWAIAKTNQAER